MRLTAAEQQPCSLVLEDGTILPGMSFGAPVPTQGEVGKYQTSFGHLLLIVSNLVRRLVVKLRTNLAFSSSTPDARVLILLGKLSPFD